MNTRTQLMDLQWQRDCEDDICRIMSRDEGADVAEIERTAAKSKHKAWKDAGYPELDYDGRVVIPPAPAEPEPKPPCTLQVPLGFRGLDRDDRVQRLREQRQHLADRFEQILSDMDEMIDQV